MSSTACYHCGLPVPAGSNFSVRIGGVERPMCCPGCEAVAGAIVAGGLDNFYRYRDSRNERPEEVPPEDRWAAYDLAEVQRQYVRPFGGGDDDRQLASLLIGGISCAACVWLIEKHLGQLEGVDKVSVNANTQRAQVCFDPSAIRPSQLFAELARIGYRPAPATSANSEDLIQREQRAALRRLGVAGLGTMQVMMFAVALYFGASSGIETELQSYLRWVSLLVATPVVFFAARPFFSAAWRSLRGRSLSMDVPVSLAIGLAYVASFYATVFETGEVYFESISMFTFFLLLGRTVEMRARHRAGLASGGLAQLLPLTATKVEKGEENSVPVAALAAGDIILLRPGDTIPADGEVIEGESGVDESLLSGESAPRQKSPGSTVYAGSVNSDSSLLVRVTAAGQATRLSAIERLVERAQLEKPHQVALADRVAGWFVGLVLVAALTAFAFWWHLDAERAFWVALSVLVVTCPCALSLATPAAVAAATLRLQQIGLLVAAGNLLETLPRITRVVFDKTGTLTRGEPHITQIELLRDGWTEQRVKDCAAALESHSNHPLARAFRAWRGNLGASELRLHTGQGVEGVVDGERLRLGRADFAVQPTGAAAPEIPAAEGQWLLLADTEGPVAWIALGDSLRPSARGAVARLQAEGLHTELLSGDQSAEVARLAAAAGIRDFRAGASPEDKLAHLQQLQRRGDKVLMVGDGLNDVPVLSGADASVAMLSAADLAQSRADAILLNGDLMVLPDAIALARKCRRIVRQNLTWALGYNALALPLAVCGLVPPWAAAIGMSASSLIVVLNALRLSRSRVGKRPVGNLLPTGQVSSGLISRG
ncbi:heavy metal translocating P-type ATPase [Microbulbifer thermotolerans]|uniref:heavy metal translocating P-type ATPase n=1 Tax=Microbulbifer thermotolerans TaxID=252514 RepID=UPI002670F9A9|nr:heavy metal translocating P-type ATPase [Microbulbifer thermotolerans]WKT59583.1 heavy metal translocating P-type ATPase [Microbulbifer thermotolerans]